MFGIEIFTVCRFNSAHVEKQMIYCNVFVLKYLIHTLTLEMIITTESCTELIVELNIDQRMQVITEEQKLV